MQSEKTYTLQGYTFRPEEISYMEYSETSKNLMLHMKDRAFRCIRLIDIDPNFHDFIRSSLMEPYDLDDRWRYINSQECANYPAYPMGNV